MDQLEAGKNDADGNDHHAAEPDRHIALEDFNVGL